MQMICYDCQKRMQQTRLTKQLDKADYFLLFGQYSVYFHLAQVRDGASCVLSAKALAYTEKYLFDEALERARSLYFLLN